ncbi:MAG: CARDB domain-containing protein [Nanoarchaeota archaeon]
MSRFASLILAVLFLLLIPIAYSPPPSLHGVAGYIFHWNGTPQVPSGTSIRINESVTPEIVLALTGAGPFSGRYSVVVVGVDGDFIVFEAWNLTAYGRRNKTLSGDMDNINFNLSYNRSGESNVSIIFPFNNSKYNLSDIFNVTVNTTIIGPLGSTNCTTFILRGNESKANFTYNDTNNHSVGDISLGETVQTIWNLTALHNGSLQISAYTICTSDTSNLERENWDSIKVYLQDIIPPNITLVTPSNNSVNTTTFLMNFSYIAQDFTSPLICTLTIDGKANVTNYSAISGVETKLQIRVPLGVHTWSVNCTDEALQRGNSSNYTLEIAIPEFQISSNNITFFPSNPAFNTTVIVNASIFNNGTNATNVIVEFYQNDTVYQSLANKTMSLFVGNSSVTINASFITHVGLNRIFVKVDRDNLFLEVNEDDNEASNSLFVSAWQIYHGNTTGRMALANLLNITVINWETKMQNLYFVETGSTIVWSSLHPMGFDLSNVSTINDFLQADIAMNTTNFTDSLNLTFTENDQIRANGTFRIFNRTYDNVPIINTTNTSLFVTGIMWDSDDGGLEFDGSQDLLFITKINRSGAGLYGTYDYEIRVPPGLKDYKYPAFDTLTIYVELA